MVEIIAVIIGVVLTAAIGLSIKRHRSLVTFNIIQLRKSFLVVDNKIVPVSDSRDYDQLGIVCFSVKIVNRGWKNLTAVKLHAEGRFNPIGLEARATTISSETVHLSQREGSLEIVIDFMPSREEVIVSFLSSEPLTTMWKLAGAGEDYRVESTHYYRGYRKAWGFLKFILLIALIGSLVGIILGNVLIGSPPESASEAQISLPNSAPAS